MKPTGRRLRDALSAELTATESEAITAGRQDPRRGGAGASPPRCPVRAAGEMFSAERVPACRAQRGERKGGGGRRCRDGESIDSAALEEERALFISGSDDTFLETRIAPLRTSFFRLEIAALAAQKDIESHRAAIARWRAARMSDARADSLPQTRRR